MPYNTRRKSLSLPSLGIHLPVTNAARAAAKPSLATTLVIPTTATRTTTSSAPLQTRSSSSSISSVSSVSSTSSSSTSSAASSTSSITPSSPTTSASTMLPTITAKRPAPADAGSNSNSNSKRVKRRNSSSASAHAKSAGIPRPTPPLSPKRHQSVEVDDENDDVHAPVDMDGVVDDVVEAVVELLQSTGNRPHLIKELENHLMLSLKSVQQSANPSAIICSRLSSFMKRPTWNATRKCPLAKQLENIHPRRTYYYLTTCRHQPLPDASSVHFIVPRTSIVTPPMSSAPASSVAAEEERRREISPSPEIDLSSPGLDDFDDDCIMPTTPNGAVEYAASFASRYLNYSTSTRFPRQQRGASPPLERDEREFTQTAEGLQKQKNAGHRFMLTPFNSEFSATHLTGFGLGVADAPLFGHQSRRLATHTGTTMFGMASPTLRPMNSTPTQAAQAAQAAQKQDDVSYLLRRYNPLASFEWETTTCENTGLEELESILGDF